MVDFLNLNAKAVLLGDIPVDVLKSYSMPWESDITKHPVEKFSIADHRRVRQQVIVMDCEFMDFDIGGIGSLVSSLRNGSFAVSSWIEKRDRLREEFIAGTVLDITLPEESARAIILNVRPDERPETTNLFRFTIELEEIIVVQTQSEYVDRDSIPKSIEAQETDAQKDANKKKQEAQNKGSKQTSSATEKNTSILVGLIG